VQIVHRNPQHLLIAVNTQATAQGIIRRHLIQQSGQFLPVIHSGQASGQFL